MSKCTETVKQRQNMQRQSKMAIKQGINYTHYLSNVLCHINCSDNHPVVLRKQCNRHRSSTVSHCTAVKQRVHASSEPFAMSCKDVLAIAHSVSTEV
jgi:hypothetical protein